MALTATATTTSGLGGGVRRFLGTFTCDAAGDSGTIVVIGANVISVDFQMAGDGTDWEKAPVQVTYSSSTSTGRTTFTVTGQAAITTGTYCILAK